MLEGLFWTIASLDIRKRIVRAFLRVDPLGEPCMADML